MVSEAMVKAASARVDGTRTVTASAIADKWAEVTAISERLFPPLAPLAAWKSGLMQKLKSLTIAGFCEVSARRAFMYKPLRRRCGSLRASPWSPSGRGYEATRGLA